LDPATEQTIEQAIVRLLQNRTGIIIAHRLSTIRRADTILILEDGRIAEFGPRRQLEADLSSRYAALLRVDKTAVAV
jgi:ATP-binding cassette subfamily B protein